MSICLLVLTDGRDELLAKTIRSAQQNLEGPITRLYLHTDAGDEHRHALSLRYPDWQVIGGKRAGFGGAIARAWWEVAQSPVRYVFHLEDDFTFNRPVDLPSMVEVLEAHPHVAQLALRRQPWNEQEQAAGGIVECWPESYADREWDGKCWLEHRLFFTTNPSLYRIEMCKRGWPTVQRSEEAFSRALFADPDLRCAFWGARESGEWCTHIGDVRAGVGY